MQFIFITFSYNIVAYLEKELVVDLLRLIGQALKVLLILVRWIELSISLKLHPFLIYAFEFISSKNFAATFFRETVLFLLFERDHFLSWHLLSRIVFQRHIIIQSINQFEGIRSVLLIVAELIYLSLFLRLGFGFFAAMDFNWLVALRLIFCGLTSPFNGNFLSSTRIKLDIKRLE